MTRHTILGAGGIIGRTLGETLARRGATVRLVDRTAPLGGTETLAADLLDPIATRHAVEGSDVVHFTVGLPYDDALWEEGFPPIFRNVLAAVGAAGARLVLMDNVYMYGPVAGPQTEETPHAATTRKGLVRKAMIEALAACGIDYVIARSADFYGPGATANGTLNAFVLAKLAAGEPANWLGSVDHPHAFTYTRDIADAMAILAEAESVSGTTWHVPTATPALTIRELAAIAAAQLGKGEPAFAVLDLPTVREYARSAPAMAASVEMFYQFDRDYLFDSSRFERRFGQSPTPYAEGIRASLAAA